MRWKKESLNWVDEPSDSDLAYKWSHHYYYAMDDRFPFVTTRYLLNNYRIVISHLYSSSIYFHFLITTILLFEWVLENSWFPAKIVQIL